jgi:hypothetical protein
VENDSILHRGLLRDELPEGQAGFGDFRQVYAETQEILLQKQTFWEQLMQILRLQSWLSLPLPRLSWEPASQLSFVKNFDFEFAYLPFGLSSFFGPKSLCEYFLYGVFELKWAGPS